MKMPNLLELVKKYGGHSVFYVDGYGYATPRSFQLDLSADYKTGIILTLEDMIHPTDKRDFHFTPEMLDTAIECDHNDGWEVSDEAGVYCDLELYGVPTELLDYQDHGAAVYQAEQVVIESFLTQFDAF